MRSLRFSVAAAILFATSTVGGRAFASWRTPASGSGRVSVATMRVRVRAVVIADNNGAALYPGGHGDVIITLENPNAFGVKLTDVALAGRVTADDDHAACVASNGQPVVGFDDMALSAPILIAAGAVRSIALAGAATMIAAAPSACQGATFRVPVTVTVTT